MLRPLHHLPLLRQFRHSALDVPRFRFRLDARAILRQLLDIWQEFRLAGDIFPQNGGNFDAVFALVVFEDAAQGAFGGAEGAVEGVTVGFLEGGVGLLFLAVSVSFVSA